MAKPDVGCSCEAFAAAVRDHFIERRDDRCFLADQQTGAGMSGWTTRYGPEISRCPFCGHRLAEPVELPPARLR